MKKLFLLSNLILASFFLYAQTRSGNVNELSKNQPKQNNRNDQQGGFKKENLRFGGNFGAAFGDVTLVDISPTVGYQFTPMLQAGIGFIYNYYSIKYNNAYNYSTSVYGLSTYGEFKPIRNIFLRVEYGQMNYKTDFSGQTDRREWVQYPLVGGGVILPIGTNGEFTATLLWNLNHDEEKSIYSNPIIRIGGRFGL
ncbi:MAG: hypothetical protein LBP96_04285 [Bacteroidales bacterium]|jgi:hypothetical protein|nr:hypothetical protein [Bacteroidales bacterium]